MPDYRMTVPFYDELNGQTTRTYEGTFADDAAATAAAAALMTDILAATDAGIESYLLTKIVSVATAPAAGGRVFEVAQATVSLVGKTDKAVVTVPAPSATMFSGNSLIFTAASDFDDFIQNFVTGAGWTISDGDVVNAVITGKRRFVPSGKTNLQ